MGYHEIHFICIGLQCCKTVSLLSKCEDKLKEAHELQSQHTITNTLLPTEKFFMFLSSSDFFQNQLFEKSFRNTIRVSNSLDPDQARRFVGPGLVPNCLQKLSVGDT